MSSYVLSGRPLNNYKLWHTDVSERRTRSASLSIAPDIIAFVIPFIVAFAVAFVVAFIKA